MTGKVIVVQFNLLFDSKVPSDHKFSSDTIKWSQKITKTC